jgi:hydrogenase expression/formation protein HypE
MTRGVGKLTNEQLKDIILSGIAPLREDVVLRPGIGVDCGAIRAGGRVCVFSTDPITAASRDAGRLAVHVSLNDVAAAGAEPVGLLLTVMAPPGEEPKRLGELVRQAQEEAAALGVEILGGHTEFTDAVTRTVLCTTAIGLSPEDGRVFSSAGARPGDELVLTKWAGMEGTAIIASDRPEFARKHLTEKEMTFARDLARQISVVPEGMLAAKLSVTAMHDVTEGGVLGAAWEMAEASGYGVEIDGDFVPLLDVTKKLCAAGGLNPYRLISSGCMLMAAVSGKQVVKALAAKGIQAAVIGKFVTGGNTFISNGEAKPLEPPESDELYKMF